MQRFRKFQSCEGKGSLLFSKYAEYNPITIENNKINFTSTFLIEGAISKLPHDLIKVDVDRNFIGDIWRQKLYNTLRSLYIRYGNYNQGLTHVASYLLIHFSCKKTYAILCYLIEKMYPENIWTDSLRGLCIEISILENILDQDTKVKTILESKGIILQLFIQKYMYGLFVDCLGSKDLARFFSELLNSDNPYHYLQKFILNILKILCIEHSNKDFISLLKILRFDKTNIKSDDLFKLEDINVELDYDMNRLNAITKVDLRIQPTTQDEEDSDED